LSAKLSATPPSFGKTAPQHIAIVMDGNRRWAREHGLPVAVGHANGARKVRSVVQDCSDRGVRHLTLFAFSTENWRRPQEEVSSLMGLLALYLQKEVKDMNSKGVRLRVIGDASRFDKRIQALIRDAEANTAHNDTINLTIAANYGGRQDIVSGVKAWQAANPGLSINDLDEESLRPHLSLPGAPEPDLLIRTGGESRVSNFMLWQMAYTEMFFTDVLWPGFSARVLDDAINWFGSRDRRFGSSSPELAQAVVVPFRATR
jgi:undecaprenyl diphosphate synthase